MQHDIGFQGALVDWELGNFVLPARSPWQPLVVNGNIVRCSTNVVYCTPPPRIGEGSRCQTQGHMLLQTYWLSSLEDSYMEIAAAFKAHTEI